MENLTDGQLLTEAHMDKIRENIEFLASLEVDGAALSTLSAGAEINPLAATGYNSDWFSVATNTAYTKAHSLGSVPRVVIVEWASSASPTTYYRTDHMSAYEPELTYNATNVVIRTNATKTYYNAASGGGDSTSGYYRILAWS